jgi:predicted dehydrogenase
MNILLLGTGYWGQILQKNIVELYPDFSLETWDPRFNSDDDRIKKLVRSTHVVIATPALTHYEIVKECLLENKHVFCEKPLVLKNEQVSELYKLANKRELKLHVDWVFCFNPAIKYLKEKIEEGSLPPLQSAFMNRMNLGPVRNDVSARWDLLSHDISILLYLLGDTHHLKREFFSRETTTESPEQVRGTSIGVVGIYNQDGLQTGTASINTSWELNQKVRDCWFQFGDQVVYWDDAKGTLETEGAEMTGTHGGSPLHNSIKYFIENPVEIVNMQEKLTLKITSLLEENL